MFRSLFLLALAIGVTSNIFVDQALIDHCSNLPTKVASSTQSRARPFGLPIVGKVYPAASDYAACIFNNTILPKAKSLDSLSLQRKVPTDLFTATKLNSQFLYFVIPYYLRVYFIFEGASYHNTIAFNTHETLGTDSKREGYLLFPDATEIDSFSGAIVHGGEFVDTGAIPAGVALSLFMIVNGAYGGTSIWYTDPRLNSDNLDHIVAYTVNDSPYLLIGYEDYPGGGDLDYNDVVLILDVGEENAANLLTLAQSGNTPILVSNATYTPPAVGEIVPQPGPAVDIPCKSCDSSAGMANYTKYAAPTSVTAGDTNRAWLTTFDRSGARLKIGGTRFSALIVPTNGTKAEPEIIQNVVDYSNGSFSYDFRKVTFGDFLVYIVACGIYVDRGGPYPLRVERHSQLAFVIKPQPLSPSAGAQMISVVGTDFVGNPLDFAWGVCSVTFLTDGGIKIGPSTATQVTPGVYSANLAVTVSGNYRTWVQDCDSAVVLLQPAGLIVSPLASSVTASTVSATGSGLVGGKINTDLSVVLTAKDSYGNLMDSGDWCSMIGASYRISSATLALSVAYVGDGKCEFNYVPSELGTKALFVSYSGVAINGSPFTPVIVSQLTDISPSKSFIVNKADVQTVSATNSWGTAFVQAVDSGGRWLSSANATVTAVATPRVGSGSVSLSVANNGDGTYSIGGAFPSAGVYDVAVIMAGSPIKDSPFAVTVSALDPLAIISDQLPRTQEIGASTFTVRSDPAGVALSKNDWVFTLVAPDQTLLSAVISTSSSNPNTLSVSFTSNNPGVYRPIGTYIKTLVEFPLGAISIRLPSFVVVPNIAQTGATSSSFSIFGHKIGIPEDQYLSNPLGFSWGACLAVVMGPGQMERRVLYNLTDVKTGAYNFNADLKIAGDYRVYAADCSGNRIVKEPATLKILSGPATVLSAYGPGASGGPAGQLLPLDLYLFDSNNNPVSCNPSVVSVQLTAPDGSAVPATVSKGVSSPSGVQNDQVISTCQILYSSSFLGQHNLTLGVGDSGFLSKRPTIVSSIGDASPANAFIVNRNSRLIAVQNRDWTAIVQTTDAAGIFLTRGGLSLTVTATPRSAPQSQQPVSWADLRDGTYALKFQFSVIGITDILVMIGSVSIAEMPLPVAVSELPKYDIAYYPPPVIVYPWPNGGCASVQILKSGSAVSLSDPLSSVSIGLLSPQSSSSSSSTLLTVSMANKVGAVESMDVPGGLYADFLGNGTYKYCYRTPSEQSPSYEVYGIVDTPSGVFDSYLLPVTSSTGSSSSGSKTDPNVPPVLVVPSNGFVPLEANLASFFLTFDKPTDRGGELGQFPCTDLLSVDPPTKLGSLPATCVWTNSTTLSVQLGLDASLIVGDSVSLVAGIIRDISGQSAGATGSVAIGAPESGGDPSLVLQAPNMISSCDPLTVTAVVASGAGARGVQVSWQLISPSPAIRKAIATRVSSTTSIDLVIPSGVLQIESYTFQAKATNFLGLSATATATIAITSDPVPILSTDGPLIVVSKPTAQTFIRSLAQPSSCSTTSRTIKMIYNWIQVSGDSQVLDDSRNTSILMIPANTLKYSRDYKYQVTATLALKSSSAFVTLRVLAESLSARIAGGDRLHPVSFQTTISAITSADDAPDADTLTFSWSCSPAPCFSSPISMLETQRSIMIPSNTLALGKLTFSLQACKSSSGYPSRICSPVVNQVLDVEEDGVAVIGSIYNIDGDGASGINPSQRIILRGQVLLNSCSFPERGWLPSQGDFDSTDISLRNTNMSYSYIVFNPDALFGGQMYTWRFEAACFQADSAKTLRGYFDLPLQMDNYPHSGTINIAPTIGEAVLTSFTIEAYGWTDVIDDLPLAYEFWHLPGNAASYPDLWQEELPLTKQTSFRLTTILPRLNSALSDVVIVVYIIDNKGARKRATYTIRVSQSSKYSKGSSEWQSLLTSTFEPAVAISDYRTACVVAQQIGAWIHEPVTADTQSIRDDSVDFATQLDLAQNLVDMVLDTTLPDIDIAMKLCSFALISSRQMHKNIFVLAGVMLDKIGTISARVSRVPDDQYFCFGIVLEDVFATAKAANSLTYRNRDESVARSALRYAPPAMTIASATNANSVLLSTRINQSVPGEFPLSQSTSMFQSSVTMYTKYDASSGIILSVGNCSVNCAATTLPRNKYAWQNWSSDTVSLKYTVYNFPVHDTLPNMDSITASVKILNSKNGSIGSSPLSDPFVIRVPSPALPFFKGDTTASGNQRRATTPSNATNTVDLRQCMFWDSAAGSYSSTGCLVLQEFAQSSIVCGCFGTMTDEFSVAARLASFKNDKNDILKPSAPDSRSKTYLTGSPCYPGIVLVIACALLIVVFAAGIAAAVFFDRRAMNQMAENGLSPSPDVSKLGSFLLTYLAQHHMFFGILFRPLTDNYTRLNRALTLCAFTSFALAVSLLIYGAAKVASCTPGVWGCICAMLIAPFHFLFKQVFIHVQLYPDVKRLAINAEKSGQGAAAAEVLATQFLPPPDLSDRPSKTAKRLGGPLNTVPTITTTTTTEQKTVTVAKTGQKAVKGMPLNARGKGMGKKVSAVGIGHDRTVSTDVNPSRGVSAMSLEIPEEEPEVETPRSQHSTYFTDLPDYSVRELPPEVLASPIKGPHENLSDYVSLMSGVGDWLPQMGKFSQIFSFVFIMLSLSMVAIVGLRFCNPAAECCLKCWIVCVTYHLGLVEPTWHLINALLNYKLHGQRKMGKVLV